MFPGALKDPKPHYGVGVIRAFGGAPRIFFHIKSTKIKNLFEYCCHINYQKTPWTQIKTIIASV